MEKNIDADNRVRVQTSFGRLCGTILAWAGWLAWAPSGSRFRPALRHFSRAVAAPLSTSSLGAYKAGRRAGGREICFFFNLIFFSIL